MNDVIPAAPTANITSAMRKERAAEGEVFENVNNAATAHDTHLKVNVLPAEPPIQFENDPLSVYSQTQGTISLDSVSDIDTGPLENLKKEQKASILPPEKLERASKVTTNFEAAPRARPITDALFCERMQPDGPYMAEHRKGDIEMEFVNQLIANVMDIVNSSGSTELELKVTMDREDNGLPKVKFELIPKARLRNPIERLNRAYVQYAKASAAPPPDGTQTGSRFSLLAVFNSMFSNPVRNLFKGLVSVI
ncbi:hypothetical protein GCK32_002847 [Trichostrongylus colubriformis]|uniref:Uncharacterized protein n=1 Tax=Trichostrongylus colubriformis TaxID=6319 RepID=A0AAN8FN91_TRICO